MRKILMRLLLSASLLAVSSAALAVFCPPNDAVKCDNGKCTLSPDYQDIWRIASVTGKPDRYVFFGDAAIQNPPGKVECTMGSSYGNYVDLASIPTLQPDTSVPGNQWTSYPGNMWICGTTTVIPQTACPMKATS